jgi:hypothetical protein
MNRMTEALDHSKAAAVLGQPPMVYNMQTMNCFCFSSTSPAVVDPQQTKRWPADI